MHMRVGLAAIVLLSGASTTYAQGQLQIVHPEPDTEAALNTYQEVRVRWLRGDRPVVGGTVKLRTDLGTIEVERAFTDSMGVATFAIRSTAEGNATLGATAGEVDRAEAELVLRFSAFAESDLPFGNLAVERRVDGQLPLWIFRDRIGFLARGAVDTGVVARIAEAEGLIQLTPLSESLFVLKVPLLPEGADADQFLRELARRLEQDHAEIFRAGRVARIVDTRQWLIVPDQLIVKFSRGVSQVEIDAIIVELGADPVDPASRDALRYVITLPADGPDALHAAHTLSRRTTQVQYAEPNYLIVIDLRDPTTDPGYSSQWHHENDGTYATEDADIDSASAWTFGPGSEDVTIAVIDRGFDINHPDLVDNLVCYPGEWCEVFGKRAINVTASDPDPTKLLSFASGAGAFAHGTWAAGVAAERGGNAIGYSGSCPQCRLMLIRSEESLESIATAFDEAIFRNVDVISNSWGFAIGSDATAPDYLPIQAIVDKVDAAVNAGITVAFAMSNEEYDNCIAPPDTSSLHNVIGVSGITDYDRRSNISGEAMGYGPCMDVLGPTRGGKRGIRTTSVARLSGVVHSTYWHDFSGTSAATPMVTGIVGLMKSQMPDLSPLQIQRILQDTADRADPQHAGYSPETGFSEKAGNSTHGYGRVNSYEAVLLVTPLYPVRAEIPAGRGGRDLVLRDHDLDWGNTEQPSSVIFNSPREERTSHRSADIKVDAYPFQTVTQGAEGFAALVAEEPEAGKPARVYVRVRNRGPTAVQVAQLKLHHAVVADTFPDLPAGFWASFPADPTALSDWRPVPPRTLTDIRYSGSSVAGCPGRAVPECLPRSSTLVDDVAQVVVFDLPALDWNSAAGERVALLAVVQSVEDPLRATQTPSSSINFNQVLTAVSLDNNVTLWISDSVEVVKCPQWMVVLVVILLLAVAVLILWIIWRLISGQPVASIVLAMLAVIAILIVIGIVKPECFTAAVATLGF